MGDPLGYCESLIQRIFSGIKFEGNTVVSVIDGAEEIPQEPEEFTKFWKEICEKRKVCTLRFSITKEENCQNDEDSKFKNAAMKRGMRGADLNEVVADAENTAAGSSSSDSDSDK